LKNLRSFEIKRSGIPIPISERKKNVIVFFEIPLLYKLFFLFFGFWLGITGPYGVGLLPFLWFALLHQVSREELLAKLKADFANIFSQGKKQQQSILTGWWFQHIFFFSRRTLGKMIQFD